METHGDIRDDYDDDGDQKGNRTERNGAELGKERSR